jgi:hypothetical protein
MAYKQGHPLAKFRGFLFHLSTTAGAAITGATFATTDLQIAKPGDTTYTNCDSTQQSAVVELGAGDYVYTATTTELGTAGTGGGFKVGKSGAVAYTQSFDVDPAFFANASTGTLGATAFTTNRTETTDDCWKDVLITALSGSLIGQVKKIGGYTGSSKTVTLVSGLTFTGAPSAGDVFELLVR